jgi:hypothetical protein
MAAPRKVKGLNCRDSLAEVGHGILSLRVRELTDLRQAAADPGDVQGLHDVRIAAKRVRYSLETFDLLLPPGEAERLANEIRQFQDVLGRLHDLDVLHDLLLDRVARSDEETRQRAIDTITRMSGAERDAALSALLHDDSRDGGRLGLLKVIGYALDERRYQYEMFVDLWSRWERDGFLEALRRATEGERTGTS